MKLDASDYFKTSLSTKSCMVFRREDRLGETDYQKLQQQVEAEEEEKKQSKLDA
ncbi:hypothetical protein [Vibrio sp. CAU 1672]|uniref:hypothetical protein n=1 Tax=Vibrio sp. CAU 1672 TaxID=3032594 RepID=UPI0023DC7DD6|nr:hypothetical protein [Vibrio sp. CAU 1672]MDF2155701.1 hypothetical protein [Vibrio sp. CAU 1672]